MIDALREAWDLSTGLFFDGFISALVAAVALPPLGTILALRRMPFMTIAVPALAGAGVSLSFLLFPLFVAAAHEHPPPPLFQNLGAMGVLLAGFCWLSWRGRHQPSLETPCAVLFVVAIAFSELFLLESPYAEIADQWLHHGRVLTVLPEGRNAVVLSALACGLVGFVLRRELWLTALDRDQARLAGLSVGMWIFVTLAVIGAACAFIVPELGPDVVLALLLVPATLVRPVAPSLISYSLISAAVGLISAVIAFPLAVSRDWPLSPSLTVTLVITSVIVRLVLGALRSARKGAPV